jgi:uncharacterized membrane protein YtjA (UPF0391 family)
MFIKIGGNKMETSLLYWAVVFLILSLVAGVFGFGLISGLSFTIAKWFAVIFVVLFVVTVIAHAIKNA